MSYDRHGFYGFAGFHRDSFCDDGRFIDAWLRWGGGVEGGPLGVRGLTVRQQLDGLVPGDTKELIVFPVIPILRDGNSSRQIVNAWLTIKDDHLDLDAADNQPWSASGGRQKITAINNPGFGQILDRVSGELRFDLKAGNTAFLTPRRSYYFDCKVEMSDGAKYSVEVNHFTTDQAVAIPEGAQMSILRGIHRDVTTVNSVGVGPDILHSFSLPAGSLASDGDYLNVWYGGDFAANVRNKAVNAQFDGQDYEGVGVTDIQGSIGWAMVARIVRLTATTVQISHFILENAMGITAAGTAGSFGTGSNMFTRSTNLTVANLNSNAIVMRVRSLVSVGGAAADVVQNMSIVELCQQ